ncbi:hypothetical protein DAI22_12g191900 [Oryza sativa Japonica Group]|nr:uncharacterized protein LOC9270774 isoform X3 [Oryza sativa Japonica Group]KAF2908551.1 hypothetical protein DAI22_12g191900 [Oryza sativa Japonica Group]KAF2908554.1 hypothetical protein DAI22_12g191900 [Oryza sativa Japonica Group]
MCFYPAVTIQPLIPEIFGSSTQPANASPCRQDGQTSWDAVKKERLVQSAQLGVAKLHIGVALEDLPLRGSRRHPIRSGATVAMALHRGGLGSQGHEVTAKLLQRLPQRRPPLPPSAMFMKETGCNPIRWDQRRWHQESRDRSGASGMASSSLLITDQRCIGETWRLEAGRPCAMRGFQADLALMADIACAGPHLLLVNFFPIYKLGPHQHLRHFSCWSLALLSFISSLSIEGIAGTQRQPRTS